MNYLAEGFPPCGATIMALCTPYKAYLHNAKFITAKYLMIFHLQTVIALRCRWIKNLNHVVCLHAKRKCICCVRRINNVQKLTSSSNLNHLFIDTKSNKVFREVLTATVIDAICGERGESLLNNLNTCLYAEKTHIVRT